MQNLKNYLTKQGWKADLDETLVDLSDLIILTERYLGIPRDTKYGDEMTSRERKNFSRRANSLWFENDKEFTIHALTHKYPLGPCVIGFGKSERFFNDSKLFA